MANSLPPYTQADFATAYAKAGPRQSPSRYVVIQSANERTYSGRQIFIVQIAYLVGVHLILIAQLLAPSVERGLLLGWYGESLANFALRIGLFALFFTRSPEMVANNRFIQLIPMLNVFIVGAHWAWTATLFVDSSWSFATFMTLLVLVLMSIASMRFAPASPVPMAIYWILMWAPAVIAGWPSAQEVSALSGVLVLAGVIAIGACTYGSQIEVRRYVQAADSIEALVAQLRDKNDELQRLRSEAAQQLQERSQFFSSASHDFGQRLHAMKLLAHSALTSDRQTQNRSLASLSRAVEDLQSYFRDVLEFARIESRVVTPNYSRVHLQDIFQKLAVQFESVADAREVTLRFRTTAAQVETDEGILLRVLENIIGNAIKFTRRGVLIGARRRGDTWCIEVWDQGPGIPSGSLDAIFASFYQEHVYADRQRVGVGLGLAIVKRLADGLRYDLQVKSREGRGSVFKVLLPPRHQGTDAASASAEQRRPEY